MKTRSWWSTLTVRVSLPAKMAPGNHRNHQRWFCRPWSQINDAVQGCGSKDEMEDTSYKLSDVSRSITVLSYSSVMDKYHMAGSDLICGFFNSTVVIKYPLKLSNIFFWHHIFLCITPYILWEINTFPYKEQISRFFFVLLHILHDCVYMMARLCKRASTVHTI